MLSVSTLAYLTYFGRTLREATTRNTSAFAHLRSGGSSSLFLRDRGNGEIKEQRLFRFARSSSPKQKKKRLTAGQGLQAISTLVVQWFPHFSSLPSLLWWYIVCFHLFIAEYLNIWKSQLFRVGGPIKWLLLVVNNDAEHRSIMRKK